MKDVVRMCCVCRKKQVKSLMIRIVKQNNSLEIDNNKHLTGKACYVCKDKNCVDIMINKKVLNRTFKQNYSCEIYDKLREELLDIWQLFKD